MSATHYRQDADAVHARITARVRRRTEEAALIAAGQLCPGCRRSYKRGVNGRCADCGAAWAVTANRVEESMAQQPDTVVAKDAGGGFDPHPEGQYPMVCVDVVDLGLRVEHYQGQPPRESHKAALVFASGERNTEGQLILLTAELTVSMNEKANMRGLLEAWRGKPYTPDQIDAGVPLEKLQGQVAYINVVHKLTKQSRKFAKIGSIMPLPKMATAPGPDVMQDYTRPAFFAERKKGYAADLAKHRGGGGSGLQPPPPDDDGFDGDDDTDDLPF